MRIENKILPNEEQIKGFTDEPEKGPIKMLNLIKLKNYAEYADGRETNLSGLEAYMLYGEETKKHLEKVAFLPSSNTMALPCHSFHSLLAFSNSKYTCLLFKCSNVSTIL